MGVSKVYANGKTLIDLTADTISANVILKGYKGHNAAGEPITGTKEFKTQAKSVTPSKSSQSVASDSGYDGLSRVTVKAIPSNYIDTSDANAVSYDIYNGKIAYVNGKKVTGAYDYQGHGHDRQWNANSSGCSATALVIPVPFTPEGCCVCLNSATYNSNTIVSADFRLGGVATYHTYKGSLSGMTRSQYTSNVSSYISYDENTKELTIKSASSSYKWSTANYRVLVFR